MSKLTGNTAEDLFWGMNAKALKKVIALIVVVIVLILIYLFNRPQIVSEDEFITFYYGSSDVEHDAQFGSLVEGPVIFGLYCTDAGSLVEGSKLGDVVISGRADSYDCQAIHDNIAATVVAGYGNVDQYVEQPIEGALVISHGDVWGAAYGPGIGYYVEAYSLSEAMPYMANILLSINRARKSANLPAYTVYEMNYLLTTSSDGVYVREGKEYGKIINLDRAIDYAVNGMPPPEPCPICAIPAMLYILGE